MIKIINGKRYNTETATLIHEWTNRKPCDDPHCCTERLYITTKGAYFLHGDGGSMSKYSNAWSGEPGSGRCAITPLSKQDAAAWLEEHDGEAILERYFSDGIEDA